MEMGIAVVVNDRVISELEVNDRIKLVTASSGMPNTADVRERVKPQVLNGLIEEALKIEEADRYEVIVSDAEISDGLQQIAQQNNFSLDQFRQILRAQNIPQRTIEQQVRAQIAWGKVVQEQLRPQVVISERDIDAELERLRQNLGEREYLVYEIFLPFTATEEDRQVQELAQQLRNDIASDAVSFPRVAQQFSKAPGAAQGGRLGWVAAGQLREELDERLPSLQPGQVSNVIRSALGYHMITVRQTRTLTEETLPSRDEILTRLGLERLERLQARTLADLRAGAFIENRG